MAAPQSAEGEHAKDGWAPIGDRFRLLADNPTPEFDRAGAKAFLARDLTHPSRAMVGLVCEPDLLPRIDVMRFVRSMTGLSMMRAADWGSVMHPEHRKPCLGIVFDRPVGTAAAPSMTERFTPYSSDVLRKTLLLPAVESLLVLSRRSATHRAIRPDNVFLGPDKDEPMILGECVSSPPGYSQPAYMETIEMAMTPPAARGRGGTEHDMYALGATALFLALGHCPVSQLTDEEVLARKVEQGSFQALLNGERSPFGLRELLRGLLADDPQNRWTAEDVLEWLDGGLRRSVRPGWHKQVERPFAFRGADYRHPRALAQAFGDHPGDAAKAVKSLPFRKWVGLGAPEIGSVAIDGDEEPDTAEAAPLNAKDLTRICMQLDPLGPLRYQGTVLNPDALGEILFDAVIARDDKNAGLLLEMITAGIIEQWLDRPAIAHRSDTTLTLRLMRRLQGMLRNGGPTNGVERCLYEISPHAPCLSPAFANHYVHAIGEMLPALEAAVAKTGRLPPIFDRHIASFIAARIRTNVEAPLLLIGGAEFDSIEAKLGILAMLGALQRENGPDRLPALTEALADHLEPALAQYQSRSLRSELRHRLEAVASRGRLFDLHDHLNNPELLRRDKALRELAEREFHAATIRINELESSGFEAIVRGSGWRAAAMTSNAMAVLGLVVMILW